MAFGLQHANSTQDDGMYALAVIDWLVAQHNQLVQIVAGQGLGFRG